MHSVKYGEVVYKRPNYRIQEVTVSLFFSSPSDLFELQGKIRGRWVFIRREHIILNTKEGRANALARIKQTGERFDSKTGYFRVYAKHEHPLDEFRFKEGGGLENFTHIERLGKPQLWNFSGNHQHYSAAFTYLVWDTTLANQIKKKLNMK